MNETLISNSLRSGDTVGVVAVSGPVEGVLLEKGISVLKEWGLNVILGENVLGNTGYLAGTDHQRSNDLNSMLARRDVKAVFFARGGYGSMRILNSIDYRQLEKSPKPLVGMSDLTALQMAMFNKLRLVTFAGPSLAGQLAKGLDAISKESLFNLLFSDIDSKSLIPQDALNSLKVIREGKATGPLLGGCLSMITALMGTNHSPHYSGAIMVLEDIGEPAYRIDRMFTQLKLSGVLDNLRAIILGHFVGPKGACLRDQAGDLAFDLTRDSEIPIIKGYPHGHALPNLTLPMGATVYLDTSNPEFRIIA